MAISSEKRIKQLENSIKELKSTYTISGGLIKSYESISPTYSVDSRNEVTIKFTPRFPQKDIFISSIYYELVYDITGERVNFSSYVYIEPQDDKDYILLKVPTLSGTLKISVVGTSPGTFTRIQ